MDKSLNCGNKFKSFGLHEATDTRTVGGSLILGKLQCHLGHKEILQNRLIHPRLHRNVGCGGEEMEFKCSLFQRGVLAFI